jgi:microprocessor complex subunit DGCR8
MLPKGTTIITIPVVESEADKDATDKDSALHQRVVKKSKKNWMLNPSGKSFVCILHEYLQHSLKAAPVYQYGEVESANTPYR